MSNRSAFRTRLSSRKTRIHSHLEYAQYELFWAKVLANIIPGVSPLSVNQKKIKKMLPKRVVFSKIDPCFDIAVKRVSQEQKDIDNSVLLTIILLYFYRLNNYQNYTVKFSNSWLQKNKVRFKNLYASQLPISTDFNETISFNEAFQKVSFALHQLQENKTYAQDIVLRHPELAENATLRLISIIITEDVTKIQPSEIEALAIFINREGAQFSIYSREEAFPVSVNTLISNMSAHITTLMEHIACNFDIPINKLLILTKHENQKILLEWNNTKVTFKNHFKPIHYFFEEQVLKTPYHLAVVFENKSLTYFELNKKANQVAQHLTQLGVQPDSLIGICAKRSLEMIIGILGILKAGCAYLPLDPNYPAERLSYMLSDSKAPIVLTDAFYPNLKTDILDINTVEIEKILEKMNIESDINVANLVKSENLAYIIYTSGTTGEPKGVAITHRSLVNHMLWMLPKFNLTEKDVFLQKTSFSFDASVWEFFAPLLCGGKLILASNADPIDFNRLIKKHKVTVLQLVPSILRVFLEDKEFQACDSLQQVFAGGEALLPDIVSSFHKKMQAKLHNLYGPTETTIQVTTYTYDRLVEHAPEIVFIGKPISNVQIYVLDKYLNPMPVGVPGELYIGGLCLARGYLNREALTQSRFIQNPFDAHKKNKLYKTGDMVRLLPDGNLEYLDRLDNQIKFHGFRIELSEIEATLLQHKGIRECAVVAQERSDNNDNLTNKCLTAYYVKHIDLTHLDTEDFISTWETLYQSEYLSLDIDNFKQNTRGWNSSYTDEAIDQAGIHEWINETIARIQQYNPKNILEIGSGSGLILFNMLDNCRRYCATDFSKNVINYTKNVVDKFGYGAKVSTIVCTADKIPYTQLQTAYDTVILNSVLQYFPSLEYLETVIINTIANLYGSGQIFIGDVRDFRLLKCFHLSVQTYKQKKITPIEMNRLLLREKELLVSPEYFVRLKCENKDISHVEILPKLGKANHEMNNYRYDVVLHIRKNKENSNDLFIDETNFTKVLNFEEYLESNINNDYIYLKYPNKRIVGDYIEYNKNYGDETEIDALDGNTILSISQISEFSVLKNRQVKFFIDVYDPLYLYVIIFKKNALSQKNFFVDYIVTESIPKREMANKPLVNAKLLETQFSNELKIFLSTKLPSYMIPKRYVSLEKMPLNMNGKLDKKALMKPEFTRSEGYVAPRNALEIQICQIWTEVLGFPEDTIGIHDDFFDLGGNSLSALRTLSLAKNFFLIKLPTRTIFDYPTIEKLSEFIHALQHNPTLDAQQNSMLSPIITLQKNGFEAPLFLIHPVGGTIFWYNLLSRYLGKHRPIYAIQDPGIDAEDLLFKSIQEMASFYLKAIQNVKPSGPYLLAGASFGGTIALEIANQLLQSGEKVNFIGLLDSWPVYSKKFWEKEFFEQLMLQQFQRMDFTKDFQFLLKLQKHRMSMLRYYKIPLVNAKITFFKAEELWPVFKEMPVSSSCWEPFSTKPVDTHMVPGNHETMFWEPHVQVLADKIHQSIDKIEDQNLPGIIRKMSFVNV
jgi:amino acid adenylation domain-containing protein